MENFLGALVPIIAIVCVFGLPILTVAFVLVKLITSNNKERLELARHGIIPPVQSKPSPNKYRSLRSGILCIGVALGIILGLIIMPYYKSNEDYSNYIVFVDHVKFLILCSTTILSLGLSYLVFYLIVRNKNLD